MSDDFMYEEDDEFDFEYEEDDGNDEDLGLESKYYNAKAQRDDPAAALSEFQAVVSEDQVAGTSEWGFKATKQIIKLHLQRPDNNQQVLSSYEKMLDFVRNSTVTSNYAEKSINNMLERVGGREADFTRKFYQLTLAALKQARNDRLWLRTSLRLAKLLLDQGKFAELEALLAELRAECRDAQGQVILERGTQLLEINAMYLGMYSARNELKKLKDTYLQCVSVKSALPHPRTMGFIRECGGKMYMAERNWAEAQSNFFDAFKNYDEAGSPQRVQVLKYLVLASMLSETEVNPLSSPEARSYESDPAIVAMTSLVRAYESQQVHEFERILVDHRETILGDPFIARYIDDLRRTFRMQALQGAVAPYTRVRIDVLGRRLKVEATEVEDLLVALILDKRLDASIDQENGILVLRQETSDESQYDAVSKWATSLETLMQQSLSILS
ncbi:hypothetical protein LPJ66_008293 [Kickxella alabastrina]|uniref:Uncharacterized protein n=1 Tax=Kickxella alabastrina TaxID=61397 RepID=A0ACC1IEQ4_9FUNG|nr:hypothetical protein LPJ66_008293 [Kickxella alabastrina]